MPSTRNSPATRRRDRNQTHVRLEISLESFGDPVVRRSAMVAVNQPHHQLQQTVLKALKSTSIANDLDDIRDALHKSLSDCCCVGNPDTVDPEYLQLDGPLRMRVTLCSPDQTMAKGTLTLLRKTSHVVDTGLPAMYLTVTSEDTTKCTLYAYAFPVNSACDPRNTCYFHKLMVGSAKDDTTRSVETKDVDVSKYVHLKTHCLSHFDRRKYCRLVHSGMADDIGIHISDQDTTECRHVNGGIIDCSSTMGGFFITSIFIPCYL